MNIQQKWHDDQLHRMKVEQVVTHDSLKWSQPEHAYRVRLVRVDRGVTGVRPPSPEWLQYINELRTMYGVTGSKSKAKVFHGLLEGDYHIATNGFYTNNVEGLAKLLKRYPEMFESVQSKEQYDAAQAFVEQLTLDK